uniref:Uncharacterized protein n=1 Tax=Oryza meridionalis TaxID=40149 RepID=A0A0E0E5U3_9ORYZ
MAEREGTPASRPASAVAPPPLAALSLSLSSFASSSPVVEVVVPAAEGGSGRARRPDRNLPLGQRCARAASLGHVDTLRELGHCLQKGYGVRCSVLDGRRLLIQANARELAAAVTASASLLRATGELAASCAALLPPLRLRLPRRGQGTQLLPRRQPWRGEEGGEEVEREDE